MILYEFRELTALYHWPLTMRTIIYSLLIFRTMIPVSTEYHLVKEQAVGEELTKLLMMSTNQSLLRLIILAKIFTLPMQSMEQYS